MTFADDLKTRLREVRAIPGQLGLRPHRVFIVVRTWADGAPGSSTMPHSEEEEEITHAGGQPPRVKQIKDERLAIGNLPNGSLEIGPITPPDNDDPESKLHMLVRGDLWSEAGTRVFLRIEGTLGNARYRISSVTAEKATGWKVVAIPMETVP